MHNTPAYNRQKSVELLGQRIKKLPSDHTTEVDMAIDKAVRLACQATGTKMAMNGAIYGYVSPQPTPIQATPLSYDNSFAGRICAYMESQGYRIDKEPGQVNIIYVEGCNASGTLNDDAPNQFNDRRLVIVFENGQPKIIGNWEATTEPGTHYTRNPMNPKGAARIAFGQYLDAWEVGIHGNAWPHKALVQVGPITVHRDFNQDGFRTDDKLDTGLFAINQHGGYNYPQTDIIDSSAGCQVGRMMDGHEQFMDLVESDPRYRANNGYRFATTIIPGDALAKK